MIVDLLNAMLTTGSGTAALRLHQGLRAIGVDSRLWVKRSKRRQAPTLEAVRAIDWPLHDEAETVPQRVAAWWRKQRGRHRLKAALRGRPPGLEVFSTARRERPTPYDRELFQGDVLHLHWVNGLLDWPSFFAAVPDDLPIVWTLHDMHAFTGGCHHSDACRAFENACHHCPQLGNSGERDLAAISFADKLAAYRGKQLHIVTPSRWLECHVRNSALFASAASVRTIRNGLDTTVFRPLDRSAARRELGLDDDRFAVGFGAASLKNPRKGVAELLSALQRLPPDEPLSCIALGSHQLPTPDQPSFPVVSCGYVDDPRRQATIYNAMDLFVLPSWAENLPQMAVEALACGTPVLAFDVGGIPEIVQPGITGWLAPLRDIGALADRLRWCLRHRDELLAIRRRARQRIEGEYSLSDTAAEYAQLYAATLDDAAIPRTQHRRAS